MDTIFEALNNRLVQAALGLGLAYIVFAFFADSGEKGVEFSVPVPEQCMPGWQGKVLHEPLIRVPGSTAIQCYAPASGKLLGTVNATTPDDIDKIVAKASAEQQKWKQTTFPQRRKVLRTLMKFISNNQEDIVRAACLDSGKTRVDAIFGEVLVTLEKLQWTITHGEKALKTDRRPTNLFMFYKKNEVRYEPFGIVAACVSWNYPFHNLFGPLISAIFSGNAIIVKGSEQTAWSTVYFISIVKKALSACGHGPDLVHAISCWPETADYLTSHPQISHVTFIGSKPVAHAVALSASKSLTPLCLELGGKDAAIVLDQSNGQAVSKAELGRIANIIMRGVFQASGQNCVGIERIVAMPKAYDALIALLEPRIKALRLGDDLDPNGAEHGAIDVGATISSASFDRLEKTIAEAEADGARVLVGGRRFPHPRYPSGHYFEPTLIVDVTSDMRLSLEELFGPICVFMKAETVDDAITIANKPKYGLGCSVFGPCSSSDDLQTLDRVADSVKVGMVAVNDFAAYYVVQLPFGGLGGSGYGRFAGEEGLRSLCNPKSVCADKWPTLIKTSIPGALEYPMKSNARHTAQDIIEIGYGPSLARRLQSIRRMAGL